MWDRDSDHMVMAQSIGKHEHGRESWGQTQFGEASEKMIPQKEYIFFLINARPPPIAN